MSTVAYRCNHWRTGKAVGIPNLIDVQCTRDSGHAGDHINGPETWNDAAGEWRTEEEPCP